MPYDKYETVIGLEIHVQLSTQSKAFCGDSTQFGAEPNTHISAISLGYPGTLPRVNSQQIAYAVRLGLALGSEVSPTSYFDRKNYFYADLPKGYQITQDRLPICIGGTLDISTAEGTRQIRFHHIHMEEDAGKSIHTMEKRHSLIDLNRAGVPLLEIVTEPDLRSADEVDALMTTMRQLVRYLDISDGNMEEGSMRCDCNVSVRLKGATTLGKRCEIKNLNSMRYARRAIAYEVKRQIDIIEAGGTIRQQTLNFDPQSGVTSPLREKEDAHDYRYFPEPDLPPVELDQEYIDRIKKALPKLPWQMQKEISEKYKLSNYDANLLCQEKSTANYFLSLCQLTSQYKAVANLIINKINPYCQENQLAIDSYPVSKERLVAFIDLIGEGKVSSAIAYQRLLPALINDPEKAPLEIAEQLNLVQSSDEDFLIQLIEETIQKYPDKVAVYKKGKKGLLGFFMGEVMRSSKGKADPKRTNQLLREKLDA